MCCLAGDIIELGDDVVEVIVELVDGKTIPVWLTPSGE